MGKRRHRKRRRRIDSSAKDFHHIFYSRKSWSTGYAKQLRSQPYCGSTIPKFTLHREIHKLVKSVPCPSGYACREVLEMINMGLREGIIELDDPINDKLSFLSMCFKDKAPNTARALASQREVVEQFLDGWD